MPHPRKLFTICEHGTNTNIGGANNEPVVNRNFLPDYWTSVGYHYTVVSGLMRKNKEIFL